MLTTTIWATPSKIRYGPLPLRRRIGLCRLLPEFDGEVRVVLVVTIIGIAGYLAFLMTIDVPMYLEPMAGRRCRWQQVSETSRGSPDVSTRWVVTHDLAEWKGEIAWMSLYFSARSGPASRCAFSTRSGIICRAIVPKRSSQAHRRTRWRSLASRTRRCRATAFRRALSLHDFGQG